MPMPQCLNALRRATLVLLLIVAQVASADEPSAADACYGECFVKTLGSLERQALAAALKAKGATLEPNPAGKRVRRVLVHNLDVFVASDGRFLRWFNRFHVTTKPRAIASESVILPGMLWSDELLYETVRNFRDPRFSSLAIATPVTSDEPGTVDILIVTRDIWSLRANSDFRLQGGRLSYLRGSISENNALGLRKLASVVIEMNESDFYVGPYWVDKNVGGKRFNLAATGGPVFGRATGAREGSYSEIDFSRPFFSLATKWSYGIGWSQRDYVARSFIAGRLRAYDAPETEVDDAVPWEYRYTRFRLRPYVARRLGGYEAFVQRLTWGVALASRRARFERTRPVDPVVAQSFIDNVFPRSEFANEPFVGYDMFEPDYQTIRNVETFDVGEDFRFGPTFSAEVGATVEALGSDVNYARGTISGSYTLRLGADGFWRVAASAETRYEHGDAIDNGVAAETWAVLPTTGPGRFVTKVRVGTLFDDTQNRFYEVGGDTGLRGYETGQFTGPRRLQWSAEFRTKPVDVGFLRVGGVAFYDLGGAAATFDDMALYHDVGLGMRVLIPQTSTEVLRVDWALPLETYHGGFPGRITAGFLQAF